jgi:hypothetical protein
MIIHIRYRPRTVGARFVHPIDPMPRTAILASGFLETKMARVFPQGWDALVARFKPTSIAGPIERLRQIAREGVRLDHAVIVLTYPGESGLSHADRDMLWRDLGVPVFEQYLDRKNRLLAMECDAHSGMHVVAGCAGLELESDPCACGNRAPRLSGGVRGARIEELAELLA